MKLRSLIVAARHVTAHATAPGYTAASRALKVRPRS